jgi:hypothetical protein
MNEADTYIYPDGPADMMNQDEMVTKVTETGNVAVFADDLIEGDKYFKIYHLEPPRRKARDVLDFIESNRIEISYFENMLVLSVDRNPMVETVLLEPGDLRTAVEALMDYEEL